MIISHKHKLVFTRPMKVGSTSVQAMLLNSGILGDGDYHSGGVENCFDKGFTGMKLPESLTEGKSSKELIQLKLKLVHATPTLLKELGLLTYKQLIDYTFISVLRNPIERFMSAWVMEVIGGYYLGNSYLELLKMIDKNDLPYITLFSKPEDYFCYKGKQLPHVNILETATLTKDVYTVLEGCNTSVTAVHAKKTNYPAWAKGHYTDYIPKAQLENLYGLLSTEIQFYEHITGERV